LRVGLSIRKTEKKTPNSEKRLPNGFGIDATEGNSGRLIIQLICAEQIVPLDE
jgi:hypothetical protein